MRARRQADSSKLEFNAGPTARDLLLDLAQRIEEGGLPIASDDERRAWVRQWIAAHPGSHVVDPAAPSGQRWEQPLPRREDMPPAMARRDALSEIEIMVPFYVRVATQDRAAGRLSCEAFAAEMLSIAELQ